MMTESDGTAAGGVAVLEPSPVLMIAVDTGAAPGGPAVHLHAGGQGFWVARMAAELGGRPRLCAPLGGRPGLLLPVLMELDGVEVDPVACHRSSSVWISTGLDGDRATIVETPSPPLDRHEADRLYGLMLTAGLRAGVAVLTGLADPRIMSVEFYRRIAADLSANGVAIVADVSSQALVVSRAAEPAIADTGAELVELHPPRLVELNRRGAGDAMTGALAAGLVRGLPLREVLRLAVAAGSLNVVRYGLGTGERRAIERLAEAVRVAEIDGAASSSAG